MARISYYPYAQERKCVTVSEPAGAIDIRRQRKYVSCMPYANGERYISEAAARAASLPPASVV
eukprot:scaffold1400_cov363-Pavlova_lutheri.AAC.1